MIRLDRENPPIDLLGSFQPAGLMVLEGNRQCFGNRCHEFRFAPFPPRSSRDRPARDQADTRPSPLASSVSWVFREPHRLADHLLNGLPAIGLPALLPLHLADDGGRDVGGDVTKFLLIGINGPRVKPVLANAICQPVGGGEEQRIGHLLDARKDAPAPCRGRRRRCSPGR